MQLRLLFCFTSAAHVGTNCLIKQDAAVLSVKGCINAAIYRVRLRISTACCTFPFFTMHHEMPQNCSLLPPEGSGPPSNNGFLNPANSISQTALWSVQSFLQGSRLRPTDTQTTEHWWQQAAQWCMQRTVISKQKELSLCDLVRVRAVCRRHRWLVLPQWSVAPSLQTTQWDRPSHPAADITCNPQQSIDSLPRLIRVTTALHTATIDISTYDCHLQCRAVLTNGHTVHVSRAPGFFSFWGGPNWLWWNKSFKTNYLITFAKITCKGDLVRGPVRLEGGCTGPQCR